MKHVFFLMLILLASCKTSSRITAHSKTEVSKKVEATAHTSKQSQSAEAIHVQNNIATDTEDITTWYDTSKPVNPATGKPPVAKTQIKKSKQTDNSKSNIEKESVNKIDSGATLKVKQKESTKENLKSAHDSEASLSLPWRIYLIAIVVILAALYFFCPPFKIFVDARILRKQKKMS